MKAIDAHIHPPAEFEWQVLEAVRDARKYVHAAAPPKDIDEVYEKYKSLDIMAILMVINDESVSGIQFTGNDYVARAVKKYSDVFRAFGSIDPHQGKKALNEIERIKDLGLLGVKFQQAQQEFFVNDIEKCYPFWAKCQELGLKVLFHMGQTGIGMGAPGGRGIRQKYCRPLDVDDVACDFPELTIVCAHPAFPWQDELLMVAHHKGNIVVDLSGWSPKYFSPNLINYCNNFLKDKVMFGTDYPMIQPERWIADFEQAPFKDEVRPKILLENARRIYGI